MAEQSESGHVCAGVNQIFTGRLRSILVQSCHRAVHFGHFPLRSRACPLRGAQDSGTQLFAQNQHISRPCSVIWPDAGRMHCSCYAQAVLDVRVIDRMTARETGSCFQNLVAAALQNPAEDI